jgi:hypothetical protein
MGIELQLNFLLSIKLVKMIRNSLEELYRSKLLYVQHKSAHLKVENIFELMKYYEQVWHIKFNFL